MILWKFVSEINKMSVVKSVTSSNEFIKEEKIV